MNNNLDHISQDEVENQLQSDVQVILTQEEINYDLQQQFQTFEDNSRSMNVQDQFSKTVIDEEFTKLKKLPLQESYLSPQSQNGKIKGVKQNERILSPTSNIRTMGSDNDQFTTMSKISKGSSQSRYSARNSRNFIESNLQVKTMKELSSQNLQRMKERQTNIQAQKKQTWREIKNNLYDKSINGRLQQWSQIQLKNNVLQQSRTSQTGCKNVSKDFVVKHVEITIKDIAAYPTNNLGGTFSKNAKEKAYHMTNSSSINNLHSYKSLDIPETQLVREFPTTKGNQQLKRAMNQSQVFSKTNSYLKDEKLPNDFNAHKGIKNIVHNLNNQHVQSMRLRNLSSNVL